jgi:acyl-CoA reductase-like NAD-dependent aldehyde dehydrogenase
MNERMDRMDSRREDITMDTHTHYINGRWTPSGDQAMFDVRNPYDDSLYAEAAAGTAADANLAVTAADSAFPAWADLAAEQKQALFLRAAQIVERRRDDLARILAEETGASLRFGRFQQDVVVKVLHQAASWVYEEPGEVLSAREPGTLSVAVRRPLGVVACFTPWNGANVLVWRPVAEALAVGNTVVVKPSEEAPISAGIVLAQVADEAGFPPGVVNVITHAPGAAAPIADAFYARPEVRCIYLTGSVSTGQMLAERAGRTLKRSVMELGGYNPMVILTDTDLDYAVRVANYSAFFHQGQMCMNTRKVYIERPLYGEFVTMLADRAAALPQGDPLDPRVVIGPLINDRAVAVMDERIADAVSKGARIITGGSHHGRVYQPTVLTEVPQNATADHEETFGPLLIVQPVDSPDEALESINRSLYGLTASVLTGDAYRGLEIAQRIKSGMAHVNAPTVEIVADAVVAPVGGVRNSGWGRHGKHAREDLTDLIWVTVTRDQVELPI